MNIFISTIAFSDRSVQDIIALARTMDISIEFSSGLPYLENMTEIYLHAPIKKIAHNYFPAPKVPFVLNLASKYKNIRQLSVNHCIQGLKLAYLVANPFYAAHAGFCIDPVPEELGNSFNQQQSFERKVHWRIFLQSVNKILSHSMKYKIDFLIENNVVTDMNLNEDNSYPLLCGHPHEVMSLIHEINHPRLGILLDAGHLKVSATTLGFDLEGAITLMQPYIRGIHHSDNNGKRDSNGKLPKSYWFLDFMHLFSEITHVIEVKDLNEEELKYHIDLLISSAKK